MLDANANRACEGLRTLEDVARFCLDDGEAAEKLKLMRHEARQAAAAGGVRLLAARDVARDVGATISAPDESERPGLASIVLAAGNRAAEALRVCEEAAKGLGIASAPFESARYGVYELQRELALAVGGGMSPRWRLCVLVTEEACRRPWAEVAEAACAGGATCLQLREKHVDGRELLGRARTLVALASRYGVDVVVNDRPDVALLAGARGVHLGQGDAPARDVRRLGGDRLLVGVSCATLDHARRAVLDGADYLGLGPMFASGTKAKPTLSGPSLVRDVLADPRAGAVPHLAISGIDGSNIAQLVAVGCKGVAVCAAVCGAEDPCRAARELVAAFDGARDADG